MDDRRILPLLGLALRGGNLLIGEGPAGDAIQTHGARVVLAASDAAENTRRRTERSAQRENCLCLSLPFTKEELGHALGRASAAVVAVTDAGLAAAVVRRLAETDPSRYREAAELLGRKALRAAERRTARRGREKRPGGERHAQGPPAGRRQAPGPKRTRRTEGRPEDRPKPGAGKAPYARPVKTGSFRRRKDSGPS